MNFNFKNLSENTKRIRIIPKNGTELSANIGVDNPTAMIDEDGVFSVCLSPYETPTISCEGAIDSIGIGDINYEHIVKVNGIEIDLLNDVISSSDGIYTVQKGDIIFLAKLEIEGSIGFKNDSVNNLAFEIDVNLYDEPIHTNWEYPYFGDESDNSTYSYDAVNKIITFCLSPNETPTISCDDSPSSIVLPLSGGAYYEIVDGDAVYGSLFRHLIVGAGDATYFEGLRFEVVTGDEINPITVRVVNITDIPKRIKFTALDANYLNESYFAEKGLNYAETALAHNVESLDNGLVFEFCLGVGGDDGEIQPNEMHFTTTTGTIDYYGVEGDQIFLNDGNTITIDASGEMYDITVPSGKHKIVLAETRSQSYVGLGGEALVEIHNFPTLISVNAFDMYSSPNLVKVPTVLPSNLTNTGWMFYGATSFNQDISMWDVSNVTNMNGMFSNAVAFNQPLNNWDVSKVTNMSEMFYGANAFNQPLNNWNVSNVLYMPQMFSNASAFNQDLSQWCVSNITSPPFAFDQEATNWILPRPVWGTCPSGDDGGEIPPNEIHFTTIAGSVEYWGNQGDQILLSDGTIVEVPFGDDSLTFNVPTGKHKIKLVESVDRSNYVSVGGEALVELHNFPTLSSVYAFDAYLSPNLTKVPTVLPSNITSLNSMFYRATSFNQDISSWDVSNVNSMNGMFHEASTFNQPLNNWDVSKVTSMDGMFYDAIAFNQDISSWNVSNVTNMTAMFYGAEAFDQDISMWDVSNVDGMISMFYYASTFNQDLSSWCVTNIISSPTEFDGNAINWTLPRPVWGTCPV